VLTAKEIVVHKVTRNVIFPIILFFFLTIGNYSFFRYSMHGVETTSSLLRFIPHIRFIIPVWIFFYCLSTNLKLASKILKDNFDVVAVGCSWLLSSLLSFDTSSYLLYGIWSLFSLCAVLLFISMTALISDTRAEFILRILRVLWIGNFVIVLLNITSVFFLQPGKTMSGIIFSSNSFWAYPSLIIGIVALLKLRFTTKNLMSKFYYFSIFMMALICIYFSARRSPLFILILTSVLVFIPPRLPYILLSSFIVISSFTLVNSSTGKSIINSLPDSYAKYRVERMFGWVKDQKETSYLERQKIWNTYLDRFSNKPVLGEGLSSGQHEKNNKGHGFSAHNTFIGLLAETGISGTLLVSFLLGRSIFLLRKAGNINWVKIYILLLIPTILVNWVEYNLIPGQIFFLYTFVIWLLPRGLQYVGR
jgi:hypothetical protein